VEKEHGVPTSRPPIEQITHTFQRLLAGEPDASADLIELLLEPLIAELRRSFPQFPDRDLLSDVVTDSLLKFVQDPARYNADKRGLWGFLTMDARGDLLNLLRAERRRHGREIRFDPVAHDLPDGNSDIEEAIVRKLVPAGLPDGVESEALMQQLRTEVSDEGDWHVLMLMAQGEKATAVFASALGILDRPFVEQQKLVKRAKDRLRVRLKRWGVEIS